MSIETVNPEPVAVAGESHSIDLQGQSKSIVLIKGCTLAKW